MSSSILYSPQAVRWYPGNNNSANKKKLQDITNWWQGLNGKKIHQTHITGIEQYRDGTWIPIQKNTKQYTIQNPQLSNKAHYPIVSFKDNGSSSQIETICIDFDPQKQFIIFYTSEGIERYFFYL